MNNDKEIQILTDLVTGIKNDVIMSLQAAGRVASGGTIKKLIVVQNNDKVQLEAPGYIGFLETGRGPTSPNAPAGDPTLFVRIQDWCSDKGIDQKLAYPITQKIHKQGYAGKPGVLSEPLSDNNINRRADAAVGFLSDLLITSSIKF